MLKIAGKMKIKFLLSIFCVLVFVSCTKVNDTTKKEFSSYDFKNNLKSDMDYNSIVAVFGVPSNDIGSGIHVYVYLMSDSTEVWIGYTDKIKYARHMDRNHSLIENIF